MIAEPDGYKYFAATELVVIAGSDSYKYFAPTKLAAVPAPDGYKYLAPTELARGAAYGRGVEDGIDGSGPVTSGSLVPDKRKFQSAAAKQSSGLEGGRKCKTAARDSHSPGGTIRSGTAELRLSALKNFKYVIGMIGSDTESVPGLHATEIKLGLPRASYYEGFPVRYHVSRFGTN